MTRNAFLRLLTLAVFAQSAFAQSPAQIRRADLSHTPMAAGELRVTVKQMGNEPFGGPGYAEVEVKNLTVDARAFDPERLSFVRPDDTQVDALVVVGGGDLRAAPRELLLVGRATSKQTYWLNGKLDFPLRVYYDGKQIGEVVD